LKTLDHRAVYEVGFEGTAPAKGVRTVLVDAADGARLTVGADTAGRIAAASYRGRATVREVEGRADDGHATWVVRLEDGRATEVTVDQETGEVTAWRNRSWRLFDALWSIHVFGYLDRRSPASWPLRVASFVAALAATSGAALVVTRLARRWRRRRLVAVAAGASESAARRTLGNAT
jgi:uncharacterized membrane protein YkoI